MEDHHELAAAGGRNAFGMEYCGWAADSCGSPNRSCQIIIHVELTSPEPNSALEEFCCRSRYFEQGEKRVWCTLTRRPEIGCQ